MSIPLSFRVRAVLTLAAAVLASRPAAAQEGVLEVSLGRDQDFERVFNPFRADAVWPTTAGVYEPLLVFNRATSEYQPWLATAYEWSGDSRSLRFQLREGVRWTDGETFDAEDVVFTFELLRRHPALDANGVWSFLADVAQAGAFAVEFRFERTFTPGLLPLGQQPIVPEHRWRSVSDPGAIPNPNPVATGPFGEVRSFDASRYELGRNPAYWQEGRPFLSGLRVRRYRTNEEIAAAFDEGRLDWASLFREDVENEWVAKDPANHQYWYPDLGPTALLRLNPGREPFGDARVRKALSHAIDRKRLAREAMRGHAEPADATGLADSQKRWKDSSLLGAGDWTRYDPAAAGRLLDEAGLKPGPGGQRPLRLELNVVAGWSDWLVAAGIIRENLDAVGVTVSVVPLDYQAWLEALEAGSFDAGIWFGARGPTPYQFFAGELGGTSAEADRLLQAFERTADVGRLLELARELQRRYLDLAPSLPLYAGPLWGVYSLERFSGFPSRYRPFGAATPADTDALPVLIELKPREE